MKAMLFAIVLLLGLVATPVQQAVAAPPSLLPYVASLATGEDATGEVALGEVAQCGGRDGNSEWSMRGTLADDGGMLVAAEGGMSPYMLVMYVNVASGQTSTGEVRVITIDAYSVMADGSRWGFISTQIDDGSNTSLPPTVICTFG